jgi:glycosyltransferase involved in cell wall biosynthesis
MVLTKVALVSRLYPLTHYSLYLGRRLVQIDKNKLSMIFYRSKSEKVAIEQLSVKEVWSENVAYPFQIFRAVLKDQPDVVHVQHEFNMFGSPSTAVMFPVLLLLLRLGRRKTVVTLHAVVAPNEIDAEFAEKFAFPKRLWPVLRLVILGIFRSTLLLSPRVLVHARVLKRLLENEYSADPKRIWHIPIGVEDPPAEITSNKWTRLLDGKKVILFFGYLGERKGVEYLLEAYQRISPLHPEWFLVIAGGVLTYSGPYVNKLIKLITELGIANKVIFTTTTPIPRNELHELFHIAEIVVLPYTVAISGSLVLSFAMQHGKPVIASDLGVLSEDIGEGEAGLLCKPADATDLSKALNALIDNEGERLRLTLNIRRKAATRSWDSVAKETYRLYLDAKVN